MKRTYRADVYRQIHEAAVKQKFIPGKHQGSQHPYLVCPTCGMRTILSASCNGRFQKVKNTIAALRSHGFEWQGRPAEHTAPLNSGRSRPPQKRTT
jgi:hypothetical protein